MAQLNVHGAVRLQQVNKAFARNGRRHWVLRDVDLTLNAGEFVAFLGPSGCGKSTLLNLISGIETPSSGLISLDGVEVTASDSRSNVVFQQHSLFPWMTALDNVVFGPRMAGNRDAIALGMKLLRLVGLEDAAGLYPRQLSGGMQQRVAIARALSTQPHLLLMDEPFGALDAQTRQIMQEQLLEIFDRERRSIIFVTHDIDEALYLSDRIVVMGTAPGRVEADLRNDLPRPRDAETLLSPEFMKLKREVRRIIQKEGQKVFNQ